MSREDLVKGVPIFGGQARLKISKDFMEAVVVVDGEPDLDMAKGVKEELAAVGIVHGVLGFPESTSNGFIVARGTPPVNGEDGAIEVYPFPEDDPLKLAGILRDERSKTTWVNVEKDQVVARKRPPTRGTPGVNCFGEEVEPQPGKWPIFKVGDGVEVTQDDLTMRALWAGKLQVDPDGTISVKKEVEVMGSVDLSTGNILFWGERLIIRKSIMGGMEVRVRGHMEVWENIEDEAEVEVGRDLLVKGIIRAQNTYVKVGGDLKCGSVEYAEIKVRGDLEIGDYILDAKCEVRGHVYAVGEKGLIAGGYVWLGRSLVAKVLGSPAFVKTEILAGRDPELQNKYEAEVEELESIASKLLQVKEGLERILRVEREKGLDQKGKRLKDELISALHALKKEADARRDTMTLIEQQLGQLQASQVQVLERCYPNVKIGIENAEFEVNREMEGVVFRFNKGQIGVYPLKD